MARSHRTVTSSGERLLPQVLDDLAESTPNRLYASIPKGRDLTDGFQDITVADMASCVNVMARWIIEKIGVSEDFETIAYIGIPDLRCVAIFLGAIKAGYKLLLPSPRNPLATNLSLMEQTSCLKLLYAAEVIPVAAPIQHGNEDVIALEIPSFSAMLAQKVEKLPFTKTFEDAKNNPAAILCSSGSTGPPKPITVRHATFAVVDNDRNLPRIPGRRNRDYSIYDFPDGGRFYTVYPYFHVAGFNALLVNPIFTESSSPVLGPPLMPPSGALLREVMKHQELRALYLPPSIAEQLLQEPNGLDFFRGLDFLCYTGGPFSTSAGEQLSQVTELCPLYGSTETYQVPQVAPPKEDWSWMEWNPHIKLEMRPTDEVDIFELILFAGEGTEKVSALNHNLPGVSVYPTKDLFRRHPDPKKPNLWKYHGRRDDIVVLSNGAKFNPIPLELAVQGHEALQGALVIGKGKPQACLLLEPRANIPDTTRQTLVDDIWPLVERSNSLVPGQGRIFRNMILISVPEKPFVRAGKGTIVRKFTEAAYEDEIDALYASPRPAGLEDFPVLQPGVNEENDYDKPAIQQFIKEVIARTFQQHGNIEYDDDLFSIGFDSLMIPVLLNNVKKALLASSPDTEVSWLDTRVIFQHPTIEQLSNLILQALNNEGTGIEELASTRVSRIQALIDRYSNVDAGSSKIINSVARVSQSRNVALIGSTGYLGGYIVASLLRHANIEAIFCLNRGKDAKDRTEHALRELDSFSEALAEKLKFVTVQLGDLRFGLDSDAFFALADNVDTVIYNAWRPDFSIPVQSFENPFLQGVRELINWGPRIVFISSISSVGRWSKANPDQPIIPEEIIHNNNAPLQMGYGESKYVAEQVLALANKVSKIPVSILRVGQIGGSSSFAKGDWPVQEWLRAIIETSKQLKAIPTHVASLDWLPGDAVGSIIADVTARRTLDPENVEVMNLVHDKPEPWSVLLDTLSDQFGITGERVDFQEWLDRLDSVVKTGAVDLSLYPALKFYEFFRSMGSGLEDMRCETDKKSVVSQTEIEPMTQDLLAGWLRPWNI